MLRSRFPMHMVVAVANNGTIGNEAALPWRLSSDLQRFKRLTMGHALIMGRKTYESIGKLLPGRSTIILSRSQDYRIDGATVTSSLSSALAGLPTGVIPFVVGGAEVYRLAWPYVGQLHLTRVLADVPGDTHLDPFDLRDFEQVEHEHVPSDARNDLPSDYQRWIRIAPPC
jgi:dihydrofolate reductase